MADRTIDKLVRAARDRGLTDVEAARALGVEKQVFSNWKRRGMPAVKNQAAADFIGCSVDELLDRPRQIAREKQPLHGYGLTLDGAHVGAEWQKLSEPLRLQIQTLIETLVAQTVRDGRKKSHAKQHPESVTSRSA